LLTFVLASFIACSNSDNDDSSSSSTPTLASVTSQNVATISTNVSKGALANDPQNSQINEFSDKFKLIFIAVYPTLGTPPVAVDISAQIATAITNTLNVCASSVDNLVSGQLSIQGFNFSVSITHNNLCVTNNAGTDITLNGNITFSGTIANVTTLSSPRLNINNLLVSGGGQEQKFNCSVNFDSQLNMLSEDCSDAANTDFNGFAVSLLQGVTVTPNSDGSSNISINGTLTIDSSSYIKISTTTPLTTCSGDGFSVGTLVLSGSNNSSASLDFTDPACSSATWCTSDGIGGETCNTFTYR